jgi:hypothetical protein
LPALGVSDNFSSLLSLFLLLAAIYFFVKDRLTYPRLKRELEAMEKQKDSIVAHSRACLPDDPGDPD